MDTHYYPHQSEDDEPRDKCGVFGIYAPDVDVSRIAFFALVALQHRGQESCGIATCDEVGSVHLETGMGLVNQVFNEANLKPLKGHMALGHTRYSTAGKSTIENAQPVVIQTLRGQVCLAQNGNLTTVNTLRQQLLEKGIGMFRSSDVEVITQLLAANPPSENHISKEKENGVTNELKNSRSELKNSRSEGKFPASDTWEARISSFMQQADGAYSLVIMTSEAVFGVRDFLGMRPLCIGKILVDNPAGGEPISRYMVASETCAIATIGGQYVREVRPGEIVRLDAKGITSIIGRQPSPNPALCVFEYVYFSRPDSLMQNQLIHRVRQRLGEQLAIESPPPPSIATTSSSSSTSTSTTSSLSSSSSNSDLCVIGVPDSSLPAAIGYANKCGINYSEGLTKNRYIHRTFIQPSDYLRKLGVSLKFNPLTDNIKGKRVVLVDDSIVRGNTIKALVTLLRSAGATEVHVRISSPPVRHPCFMGVDMATYEQLVSHNRTDEQVREMIGADSLAYVTHEGMMKAVKEGLAEEERANEKDAHCSACFTGKYPLKLDW